MTTRSVLVAIGISCCVPTFSHAQTYHSDRGAALGGIGGALAGAAIGRNNGDTTAGALIGGAVGLVTGAVVGNSMDEKARTQAYQQQQIYRLRQAVSTMDVITMTRNGLSDDVIANHIRENGVQRKLEVSDVITLHKNGVSESVITTMQNASVGSRPVAPVAVAAPVYPPRPIIVEEHYYSRPYWYGHPGYHVHHYHPRPAPPPHFHWGFSFGH